MKLKQCLEKIYKFKIYLKCLHKKIIKVQKQLSTILTLEPEPRKRKRNSTQMKQKEYIED